MHHPGCWVRRGGCSTERDHEQAPLVQSYIGGRAGGDALRAPGEGTRVSPAAQPIIDDAGVRRYPAREAPREVPLIVDEGVAAPEPPPAPEPVIGAAPPGPPPRRRPPAPYVAQPSPGLRERPAPRVEQPPRREPRMRPIPQRPLPDAAPPGERKPSEMPKVYTGSRLAQYWYVPVAAVVAALVAGGVIFAAEALFGGDSGGPAVISTPTSVTTTVVPGASASPSPATGASPTQPAATATGAASPITSPGATGTATTPALSGPFQPGETLIVQGTGDCLNVRQGAGTANAVVTCVDEGAQVTVLGGPQQSGGLTWWQIQAPGGTGWAAGDYLVRP
jgi:hypothetical protein